MAVANSMGRHSLLVKQDQIPRALAQAGGLTNRRPSSSGKGRRVSDKKKESLGLINKEAANTGQALLGGGVGLLGGYGAGRLIDYLRGAEDSQLPWATALLGGAAGGYAGYKGWPSRLFSPKTAPSAVVGGGGDGAGTGSAGPESPPPFSIQTATPEELKQWMYEPGSAARAVGQVGSAAGEASNVMTSGMVAKGLSEGAHWAGEKMAPRATKTVADRLSGAGSAVKNLLMRIPGASRLVPALSPVMKHGPGAVYGALAVADPVQSSAEGMIRVSRAKQVGAELVRRGQMTPVQAQQLVKDTAMLDTSVLPGFGGEFSSDMNARTDPRTHLPELQQMWSDDTGKRFEQALNTLEQTGKMPESLRLADGTTVALPQTAQQLVQLAQQHMARAETDPRLQGRLYARAKEQAKGEQNMNLIGDLGTVLMPQTMIGFNVLKDSGHFLGDLAHAVQTGDSQVLIDRNRQKGHNLRQQIENDMDAARRAAPSKFWDSRLLGTSPREAWLAARAGLKNPLYIHTALDDSLNELRKARDEAADSEHMAKIKAMRTIPGQQRALEAGTQKPESVHVLTKQKDPDWYNRVDWNNSRAYPGGKDQFFDELLKMPREAQARTLFGLEPDQMGSGDWLRLEAVKQKYADPKLTRGQRQTLSGLPEDVQRGIARRLMR